MQISCELFSSLPFPAIVADESGKVIYKNESARRYLPLVRCGAKIAPHIVDPDDVLCEKADFASFGEIEPYHRSFVLRKAVENDNFLSFLFFPTLQFGDTREAQQQIIESSAAELFGFTKFLPKEHRTNRLYGDIDRFIAKIGNGLDDRVQTFDIENIIRPFSAHLGGAFRSLGYTIHVETDRSVAANRYCTISPCSTVFLISRAIYAAARASDDGRVFLFVTYDERQDAITVTARAKSKLKVNENSICQLAPECVFEAMIFASIYGEGYPNVSDDGAGNVSVSLAFPCTAGLGGTLTLRSPDDFGTLDGYILSLSHEVSEMLEKSKK